MTKAGGDSVCGRYVAGEVGVGEVMRENGMEVWGLGEEKKLKRWRHRYIGIWGFWMRGIWR